MWEALVVYRKYSFCKHRVEGFSGKAFTTLSNISLSLSQIIYILRALKIVSIPLELI
jgi:hypothetical protein